MSFEWDTRKAASNLRKHRVDFVDAATVLYDEMAITLTEPDTDEPRAVTLGMDAMGRVLVVVYTWRGERVRLISARHATRKERLRYEARR